MSSQIQMKHAPPVWAAWSAPVALAVSILLSSLSGKGNQSFEGAPVRISVDTPLAADLMSGAEWLGTSAAWHQLHYASGATVWRDEHSQYDQPVCAESTPEGIQTWRCARTPVGHPDNAVRALLGLPICWWTANVETLDGIRGVGRGRARGLARYRDHGGMPDVVSLDRIHGVGPSLAGVVSLAVTASCDRSEESAWRYRRADYSWPGSASSGASSFAP